MENFSNEPIDTASLPRFEEVALTPLEARYWWIMLFNIVLLFLLLGTGGGLLFYYVEEIRHLMPLMLSIYSGILLLTLLIARVSFKNRGYAFRTHDVIYRSGAIAIHTTIIPYNRVQHVAVNEGLIARKMRLASVGIYTAGAGNSDIEVPGINKEQAEKIKLLLMGKVVTEDRQHEG